MLAIHVYALWVKKRTNMNLDMALVAKAAEVLGTNGTTATVHAALDEVVRHELLRQLAADDFPDLTPEALAEMRRPRFSEPLRDE
jgi:Arc/MetJ family transcription regulator